MSSLKPDISIIVPVYNGANYLFRCLDSLFAQDFSGILEVIAVDDASTDTSLELLKQYQKKEARLKIVEHGTNSKLSISRATGIKSSVGNYIMHVDQDDWLLPTALECLFEKCLETECDVLVFNYAQENSNGKRDLVENIKKQVVTTDKVKVQHHFFGAVWNKIVKRSLVGDMISGELGVNYSEDLLYSTEVLLRANKICLLDQCHYTYFVNVDSMTWLTNNKQFLQLQIVILNQLQSILLRHTPSPALTENVLEYWTKFFYFYTARVHFINRESIPECKDLIHTFSSNAIMSRARVRRIELAMKYKFICLKEIAKYFGIKTSLWLLSKSFRKR